MKKILKFSTLIVMLVFSVFLVRALDKSILKVDETVIKPANRLDALGNDDDLSFDTLVNGSIGTYSNIVDMNSGTNHTLMITSDGIVYAFGKGDYGQLGNGKSGGGVHSNIPVKVSNGGGFINDGSDPVVKVAAGESHSIIVTKNGLIYSFGRNEFGQLGIAEIGPEVHYSVPVKVLSADGFVNGGSDSVIDASAGENHSLILTESNMMYSFGRNTDGQLGNGTNEQSNTPKKVSSEGDLTNGGGSDPVIKVESEGFFNIVLTKSGKIYSFGSNSNGQLGTGDRESRNLPTKIADGENFTNGSDVVSNIELGAWHALFSTKAGIIYGFGSNFNGKLGNGKTTGNTLLPTKVADNGDFINNGVDKVIKVSASYQHTALVTESGKIYTFGKNEFGTLGNGSTDNSGLAVSVASGDGFFDDVENPVENVYALESSTIMFARDGKVYGFGSVLYGQLGIGVTGSEKILIPETGRLVGFSLLGEALFHTKSDKTKYNKNVVMSFVESNSIVKLKKGSGIYQEITLDSSGIYEIGANGNFLIKDDEESEFAIRVEKGNNTIEYAFIIDKKPPKLKDLSDKCNILSTSYYCNQDVSIELLKDLSSFYEIKRKENSQEVDIVIPDTSLESKIIDNLKFDEGSSENLSAVEYSIIDGAGNQILIDFVLDNIPPRSNIG